jgi:hypothetical protein
VTSCCPVERNEVLEKPAPLIWRVDDFNFEYEGSRFILKIATFLYDYTASYAGKHYPHFVTPAVESSTLCQSSFAYCATLICLQGLGTVRPFTLAESKDSSLTPTEYLQNSMNATVAIYFKFQQNICMKILWLLQLSVLPQTPKTETWPCTYL